MITIDVEASGLFIDKPIMRQFTLNEEDKAVELADGSTLLVKELSSDQFERYIHEKFIQNSNLNGRVLKLEITRGK